MKKGINPKVKLKKFIWIDEKVKVKCLTIKSFIKYNIHPKAHKIAAE